MRWCLGHILTVNGFGRLRPGVSAVLSRRLSVELTLTVRRVVHLTCDANRAKQTYMYCNKVQWLELEVISFAAYTTTTGHSLRVTLGHAHQCVVQLQRLSSVFCAVLVVSLSKDTIKFKSCSFINRSVPYE